MARPAGRAPLVRAWWTPGLSRTIAALAARKAAGTDSRKADTHKTIGDNAGGTDASGLERAAARGDA